MERFENNGEVFFDDESGSILIDFQSNCDPCFCMVNFIGDAMSMDRAILNEISDPEAMALLSSLGITIGDWSAITKLGGAKAVLSSELSHALCKKRGIPTSVFANLRRKFDRFYQTCGFLITPLERPHSRLFRLKRAPLTFFGRYNQDILDELPMVAIVGARNASMIGEQETSALAAILAEYSITVVSGGARGIDQAAHRGALSVSGKTVVVLGTRCSFEQEESLAKALDSPENTVMVHPFGPNLPQERFMFVERNRFVAALADVLVVMEGEMQSGSFHTARFAEAMGIPIFCRKGSVEDALSFAPNQLIADGKARLLTNFEQFAKTLVTKTTVAPKRRKFISPKSSGKSKETMCLPYLLKIINDAENGVGFDDLLLLSGLSFAQLQKELLDYELDGRIFKRGSQFVLTGN